MIGWDTWLVIVVLALTSYGGIELFRRQSLKHGWIDIPNERSQHTRPVPRGGGIVIAILCLASYVFLTLYFGGHFSWGYLVGAVIVTTVSWFDDIRSLGYTIRFLTHITAGGLVIISSGFWSQIGMHGYMHVNLGTFGVVVTLVWIVWVINAFNFMDGIDGMAGLQAIVAAAAWAVVAWLEGIAGLQFYAAAVAAVGIGFLLQNWSPARVFMGDAGSAFLGFTFASMPLLFAAEITNDASLPVLAGLFIWPVIFDSGINRLRRALRGIRFWEPNREHFYQKLVDSGEKVATVAIAYGVVSVLVSGLAIFSFARSGNMLALVVLGVLAMTGLCVAAVTLRTRLNVRRRAAK